MEKEYPGSVTVVTQTIDNLHERGGSSSIIHMHGELLKALCRFCGHRFPIDFDLSTADPCPRCARPAGLRPDVVWFGEMPHRMDEIYSLLEECSLFLAVGTSGNVYPAAGFVDFAEHRYGSAGKLMPLLVDEILTSIPHP